jgi:1-pyrroline-5-carboxylate dehydrogenase
MTDGNMTDRSNLPRVTYSNLGIVDFAPLHEALDEAIPAFRADRLALEWPNMIGGKADSEGEPYSPAGPIDRRVVLGTFIAASPAAVDRAVSAARRAAPQWAAMDWRERVGILRRAVELLLARKLDLGVACLIEVGKSRMEAMGEAEEAADLIAYYCDEMERNEGYRTGLVRAFEQESTEDVLRPVGVFAVISPFNFPLALSCNMMGAALVAGNTVVYKPSPEAGLSGALLTQALHDAGVPDGVVNMVCGEAAGPALANHPGIDGIAFTGSHEVGMGIYRKVAAGRFARPLIVEMGGKNPAYVSRSADLDVAAEGVARSAFGLQGQKCSACSVVYVDRTVHDDFLELLVEKTATFRIGNPEERDVFMGPVINAAARARYEAACRDAREAGRVIAGGEVLEGGAFDHGAYVAPAIVGGLHAGHRLNRDELFLPFLSVQPFDELEEAVRRGNDVLYGLTAGFYGRDEADLGHFLDHAQAGVLYANRRSGATTGAWPGMQPFCGWKGSGVTGKGGLGPYYVPQFMREQSRTIMGEGS